MKIAKLLTYSFNQNVGPQDRIFRILSGLALAIAPWLMELALGASIVATLAGLAWLMTGLVGRCGAYYLIGFSTYKRPK